MTSAVLTTKGQITIPAEVRKEMGLSTGDRVYFIRNPQTGRFEVTRKTGSLLDLAGFLKHEGPSVSIEQMNDDLGRHLGQDEERIKREWNEWQEKRERR